MNMAQKQADYSLFLIQYPRGVGPLASEERL
jgi:hypothetical protein